MGYIYSKIYYTKNIVGITSPPPFLCWVSILILINHNERFKVWTQKSMDSKTKIAVTFTVFCEVQMQKFKILENAKA